nr:hypothetical protein [Enterococcus casseliflavus]
MCFDSNREPKRVQLAKFKYEKKCCSNRKKRNLIANAMISAEGRK